MMDNKIHNLIKDDTAFVSETVIARKGPISDGDLYPLNRMIARLTRPCILKNSMYWRV